MPSRASEAIVLRTYPLQEADLIVSFFTRDQGKLRGVAKRARRPKTTFGAALERLSQVRIEYVQRETRELVNILGCDLVRSQFALMSDYAAGVALDYMAEISEQLLPAAEPNERFFRLLLAVLDHLQSGAEGRVWRAATYFALWAVRLSGWLPELHVCLGCGAALENGPAWFGRSAPGLYCASCRRDSGASWELSAASRALAATILRSPVMETAPGPWPKEQAAGLRRFLTHQIESHIERRLHTPAVLEGV